MNQQNTVHVDQNTPMSVPEQHHVLKTPLVAPFPDGFEVAVFGMGCFWGAEKRFWETDGVYSTAVGYAGGDVTHPTYRNVCGGNTRHAEVVHVVFDPAVISYQELLEIFWDGHNPTIGFLDRDYARSQYRSAVFTTSEKQASEARESARQRNQKLSLSGGSRIATEIAPAPTFYYAEAYHQQYIAKRSRG